MKKTCPACNIVFVAKKERSIYCSRACWANVLSAAIPAGACQECGKDYFHREGKIRRDTRKFCSYACCWTARRKPAPVQPQVVKPGVKPTKCAGCGKVFMPAWMGHKFCSSQCTVARSSCRQCERETVAAKARTYCSEACARKYANRHSKPRSRARHYGVIYEPINPLDILDRDGWRCQICGAKTPKRLRGTYDDRAPELDHRIPIAVGGGHIVENVQCACRKCNIAKGGREIRAQTALSA